MTINRIRYNQELSIRYEFAPYPQETAFFFDFVFREVMGCRDRSEALDNAIGQTLADTSWSLNERSAYGHDAFILVTLDLSNIEATIKQVVQALKRTEAAFMTRYRLDNVWRWFQA